MMAWNYDFINEFKKDSLSSVPKFYESLSNGIKILQKDIIEGRNSHLKIHFFWDSKPGETNNHLIGTATSNGNDGKAGRYSIWNRNLK